MLDTNVIVSRFVVSIGKSAQIVRYWEERRFTLLISKPLLAEYKKVMAYKRIRARHGLTDKEIAEALDPITEYGINNDPKIKIEAVKDDPDDNKVLECALAGGADYIVSGDAHLLDVAEYQGIQIVSPAAFLQLIEEQANSEGTSGKEEQT